MSGLQQLDFILQLFLVLSVPLKMGQSVFPETSVANYQPAPRINNITEVDENCTFWGLLRSK